MSNNELWLKDVWPIMKEVIDSGGEFTFLPHGTSMLPLIRQGEDRVVIAPAENIQQGDVVFYQRDNGQFVLHRIVKVKNGGYVMCGDNQYFYEYGITDKHILAKMKAVIRDGETIDCNSKKYIKYVKKLPFRRFMLKIKSVFRRIKNKIFKKSK